LRSRAFSRRRVDTARDSRSNEVIRYDKTGPRLGAWRLGRCIELGRGRRAPAKSGYTVYAPPNPLRSLSSDAATIATFVKAIPGPVILVGHSYGGAVISVASPSDPNVKALVFVDAFAPDAGESPLSLLAAYPSPPKDFFSPIPFGTGGDADVYITSRYRPVRLHQSRP
jgi:pimeloyl-ACP methyl ester carboxylesterase